MAVPQASKGRAPKRGLQAGRTRTNSAPIDTVHSCPWTPMARAPQVKIQFWCNPRFSAAAASLLCNCFHKRTPQWHQKTGHRNSVSTFETRGTVSDHSGKSGRSAQTRMPVAGITSPGLSTNTQRLAVAAV